MAVTQTATGTEFHITTTKTSHYIWSALHVLSFEKHFVLGFLCTKLMLAAWLLNLPVLMWAVPSEVYWSSRVCLHKSYGCIIKKLNMWNRNDRRDVKYCVGFWGPGNTSLWPKWAFCLYYHLYYNNTDSLDTKPSLPFIIYGSATLLGFGIPDVTRYLLKSAPQRGGFSLIPTWKLHDTHTVSPGLMLIDSNVWSNIE